MEAAENDFLVEYEDLVDTIERYEEEGKEVDNATKTEAFLANEKFKWLEKRLKEIYPNGTPAEVKAKEAEREAN